MIIASCDHDAKEISLLQSNEKQINSSLEFWMAQRDGDHMISISEHSHVDIVDSNGSVVLPFTRIIF